MLDELSGQTDEPAAVGSPVVRRDRVPLPTP
jgi:hypothetical protein